MAESELEVQITLRVRDAIRAAVEKIGAKSFSEISGFDEANLESLSEADDAYVKVTVVSVACQVNKTHGDPDPSHSSVSECLKGAIYMMQGHAAGPAAESPSPRHADMESVVPRPASSVLFDQKSVKLLNFSANTAGFLILGYFLGGVFLGPVFGLSRCVGLASTAPWIAPCLGSGLGLVVGSFAGLAYTYYYFVRKM